MMRYDGYFDEVPLYATYSEVSFLDGLPPGERDRLLLRAAVAHLGVILDLSRGYYAGRDYDYSCAASITNWEFVDEGDPIIPRFWYANPSRGVFEYARFAPPESDHSRRVAGRLGQDPEYVLSEDVVEELSGPGCSGCSSSTSRACRRPREASSASCSPG
jgi:hypothetical protein